MKRWYALAVATLVCALALVSTASAWSTTGSKLHHRWHVTDKTWVPTRAQLNRRRWRVVALRKAKCLRTWTPRPIRDIPIYRYPLAWAWWGHIKDNTKAKRSRCRPTSPAAIIRYVFPDRTERAAIAVAQCESGLYIYARNPSGASGLFQLMPFHWIGRFDPFNPWANTRYAYRLSRAGTDWSAWVCKPW